MVLRDFLGVIIILNTTLQSKTLGKAEMIINAYNMLYNGLPFVALPRFELYSSATFYQTSL